MGWFTPNAKDFCRYVMYILLPVAIKWSSLTHPNKLAKRQSYLVTNIYSIDESFSFQVVKPKFIACKRSKYKPNLALIGTRILLDNYTSNLHIKIFLIGM